MQNKALGKGLSALIPDSREEDKGGVKTIAVDTVRPNPFQPRTRFDTKRFEELVSSVKEKGVIQPVLVRGKGDHYELIAGERRLRAAKALGHKEIPVVVRDVEDADALELSLIENIQREELNPIEEAKAYKRLMDEFSFTQEEIARAVGKDRATVANSVRLLNLPARAQEMVAGGKMNMGHARALLSLAGEHTIMKLANRIVKQGLSVREVEAITAKRLSRSRGETIPQVKDHKVLYLEEQMQRILGTKVNIHHRKKRGKIQIDYYSVEDLERIYNLIKSAE